MTTALLVAISALVLAAWLWAGKVMWTAMSGEHKPPGENDDDS